MASEIETIPLLRRAVREIDLMHDNLKELEARHGANSPQVVALLTDISQRLSSYPGNEHFVVALNNRIRRLQAAS